MVCSGARKRIGIYVRSFVRNRERRRVWRYFHDNIPSYHVDTRLGLGPVACLGPVRLHIVRVETLETIGCGMTVAVAISS